MSQHVLRITRRRASLVLAVLVLGPWACAALAEVSARFDRAEVHEGETLQLVIESDRMTGDGPDLSVLGADFEVRGTATSSQIQIINGRQSATRSWQVVLAPKRTGVIEVPPIPVGDEQTSPLRLTVSDAPQGAVGDAGDDVFLDIEVGGADAPVYVQQQLPVTVRLFTALPLRMGEISEPRPEGAVVERLGEDVQYQTTRQGREYQVIERRFSLSPERSGELRIPPVRFSGELRTADRGGAGRAGLPNLFRDPVFDRFAPGMFGRGDPVRARTEAVTLDVQPVPDGFAGRDWLPARALAIDDSWERDPPNFADGEPATRVLTITATGLSGSQLPQLRMPAPDGARVYGEPPEVETRTDGKSLFGVSRQRFTVIPTRSGELRFPAIELPWWHMDSGEERRALVPARVFDAAGVALPPSPGTSGQVAGLAGAADSPGDDGMQPDAGPTRRADEPRRPLFLLPLLAGAALLWFLWSRRAELGPWLGGASDGLAGTLARIRWPWRPGGQIDAAAAEAGARSRTGLGSVVSARPRDPYSALRAAAARHDARACARELLAAARHCWPEAPPSSLGEVAARLDGTGQAARGAAGVAAGVAAARSIGALDSALYGPQAADWRGEELAATVPAAFAALADRRSKASDVDLPLPPLYPRRG